MEHMERKAPKATHLWNKKTPKALESSTFGAFEQLGKDEGGGSNPPSSSNENHSNLTDWTLFSFFYELFSIIYFG